MAKYQKGTFPFLTAATIGSFVDGIAGFLESVSPAEAVVLEKLAQAALDNPMVDAVVANLVNTITGATPPTS